MKKIYKFQIIYLICSTIAFILGLYALFVMKIDPYLCICLMLAGIGLDATTIVGILDMNGKIEKGSMTVEKVFVKVCAGFSILLLIYGLLNVRVNPRDSYYIMAYGAAMLILCLVILIRAYKKK